MKRPRESELERLNDLVTHLKDISGTKAKVVCLATYKDDVEVCKLLELIYNPMKVFGVTSKSILKHKAELKSKTEKVLNLCTLLQDLVSKKYTGHAALNECCAFLQQNSDYKDLLLCVFDKDLKMKSGVKIINQAIPSLIPCFGVSLGFDIEKHQAFYEKNISDFASSRKLDGTRALIIRGKAYSRQGKVFPREIIEGLNEVLSNFDSLQDWVFDGEMVVQDAKGQEDFKRANSLMTTTAVKHDPKKKRKHALLPGQKLKFWCFDMMDIKSFEQGLDKMIWEDRQKRLKQTFPETPITNILTQYMTHEELWVESIKKNWEGIYFAYTKAPWKSGRSRHWLKKKSSHDHEFKCVDSEDVEMAVPGSCEQEVVLGKIFIEGKVDGKDIQCKVGTGFDRAERRQFKDKALVGKLVKVRYWEFTQNSATEGTNRYSLRFPSYICCFENGRET